MMRVLYTKCAERKKANSIITQIVEDNGNKYVIKKPMFSEGKKHIQNFLKNRDKLISLYDGRYEVNQIIHINEDSYEIAFEYVEGMPLSFKYIKGIEDGNEEKLKDIIEEHKKLIIGNPKNICSFHETDESKRVFGDLSMYEGKTALKITNFEATAKNIIETSCGYTFFDYEWVFDFCIPVDLVYYQIFINAGYTTFSGLSELFPKEKMISYLGIDPDIESSWKHFLNDFYSQSGEYPTYTNYHKKKYDYCNLRQKQNEFESQEQYIENLKREWGQKNLETETLKLEKNDLISRLNEREGVISEQLHYIDNLKKEWCEKNSDLEVEKNNVLRLEEIIANKSEEIADLSSKNLELEEIRNRLEVDNCDLDKTIQEYKKYIDILEKKIRYLE